MMSKNFVLRMLRISATICDGGILFMGAPDVVDAVGIFVQFIVDRQDRSAGITEDGFDLIAAQRFNND